MEEQQKLKQLFQRFIKNECSEEEVKGLLEQLSSEDNKRLFNELIDAGLNEDTEAGFKDLPHIKTVLNDAREKIEARIQASENHGSGNIRFWYRMISAAAIILCVGTAVYFYERSGDPKKLAVSVPFVADIAPGGNKAVLTLANGSKISLTDAANGTLAKQSGISVTKTADGQLSYTIIPTEESSAEEGTGSESSLNTISTPRGGQYNVVLPDGTKIWLNASSSVSYPVKFKANERKVILTGEAYFEVAKKLKAESGGINGSDRERVPFIVNTRGQMVEVLGTHFNINGYADEPLIKTTLLEGSVRVSRNTSEEVILKPGQQSQIFSSRNNIKVVNADLKAEMAWRDNQFFFEDEPIETIMRQVSRWYDVDIVYKDDLKGKTVWGAVPRFSNISRVLRILELTGNVHFKIEGRQIIVMK